MTEAEEDKTTMKWFAMRDLKRKNAKEPAYKMLGERGIEVFTPLTMEVIERRGKKSRKEVPVITDLLFVHTSREILDPIVAKTETLQYRFKRKAYCQPICVSEKEMNQFIQAVSMNVTPPKYYRPEEITPDMLGKKVRIIDGPLKDQEVRLQAVRGTRKRRILVSLADYLVASVEISPDLIQLLN